MILFIANLYQVGIGIFKKKNYFRRIMLRRIWKVFHVVDKVTSVFPSKFCFIRLLLNNPNLSALFFFFFFLVSAKDLFVYFFNLLTGTGDREATDLEVKWEDATHISRYQIWCTVDDYVFFHDKTYLCITSCTPEKLIHVPWKALWESTTFALSCVSNFRFLTCTLQSVAWKIHYQSKLVKFSIFHIFWDIAFLKSTL